jgi:acyl-CoA thioesterase
VPTGLPPDLRAELDGLLRSTPLLTTLGIELVSWLPGSATVRMTPGTDHGNLAGSVHGGIMFALADAAFEAACNSYGRLAVALQTSCHYSRPAKLHEPLTAGAGEVSRSHRTASYKIDVRDSNGDLCAWYMALAYRTEKWHLGEERWPEDWRIRH